MNFNAAIADVYLGAKDHEFWLTYGLNDVRAKYRRSRLGQWWITLSVALFILVIGSLYGGLFNADGGTYLAYLATGYIAWLFMSASITSGCMILAQSRAHLLQRNRAISSYIYRLVYREFLLFAHHIVILVPIFIWLHFWPGFVGVGLSVLGLIMTIFTAFWVAMILAILTLRFRDIPPLINSLMRLAFFATPVIWFERHVGEFGQMLILVNPFGYYLSIIRDPIMSGAVDPLDWAVVIGISASTMFIALTTLAITRNNITYWL